ncbi:MAG: DedA family protein [Flavobacteriales bacterium AspAUS03]
MSEFWDLFQYLINPDWIFIHYGQTALFILLAIVFAETGLFMGFFLPGDSLLFAAGIFGNALAKSLYDVPFIVIILLVALAAILGNMLGYWFGYKSGPFLFRKKNSLLFKRRHLIIARAFYKRYKATALIMSRFLPMLRTFAPIIAGIVRISFKQFMIYNIIGASAWTFSIMLAGHYLDKTFPTLKNHLEWIVLTIILVTTVPVLLKIMIRKKKKAFT